MGMFSETADFIYYLSFADQGKQSSTVRFQQTKGSLLLSVFRLQQTNRTCHFLLAPF
jgi:hypothetical protein